MDYNVYKLLCKYFKFKYNTIKLFENQLKEFKKLEKDYTPVVSNYNLNDRVILDNRTLIHGSRVSIDKLKDISMNGLIAPEFLGIKPPKTKKKLYVVEFWKIDEEITLKDYIKKYCAVTIEFNYSNGDKKRVISSFENIEKEVKKENGYKNYIIHQNQEQRFLPNDYCRNNSTVAFIVKENDYSKELLSNDIFSLNFNKRILKTIVPKWFYKKYMVTRCFDVNETGREKAILYGIPSSLIEGIIVCRELENDKELLDKIKEYFPNCYICNIDGIVIKE